MVNRTYIVPPVEVVSEPQGSYARRIAAGWLPPEEAAALRATCIAWQPIETLPTDDRPVLAGRLSDQAVMIWKPSLLRQAMQDRTPRHLTFQADVWASLPIPALSATEQS